MNGMGWTTKHTLQRYDKKSLADTSAQMRVFLQNSSCWSMGAFEMLGVSIMGAAAVTVDRLALVTDTPAGPLSRERVPPWTEVVSRAS